MFTRLRQAAQRTMMPPNYKGEFRQKAKDIMLKFLRSKASGVLGILLIGLLVIAFGLWGVADTFTGFSNSVIASVGDRKIQRQEFPYVMCKRHAIFRANWAPRFRPPMLPISALRNKFSLI